MSDTAEPIEIIVQGYSDRYAAAVRDVLGIEGGYANDPIDRGGATKFGISLRFLVDAGEIDEDLDGFADFDLDMDGDIDAADIRDLTRGDAIFLYHRHFWLPLDCDSYQRPVGEMMFDQGVNGGFTAAKRLLQQALNKCLIKGGSNRAMLETDAKIGPATRDALAWVTGWQSLGTQAIVQAYRDAAVARYRAIVRRNPSQNKYLGGWLARAKALGSY